ncbi:putative disease resistance protein RGA1 [Aegilops tauschii subsp. strangulata]|nr:putative disease resistance protein RGA1 [Aegilops tauschii subsp. strangulata]
MLRIDFRPHSSHISGMAETVAAAAAAKSAAIFVGKSAAHAAIAYLIKKALGRLSAEDEDLRGRLTAKLPAIEAVFGAADQTPVQEDPVLGPLLWQFRDAIQEAEDALGELEFLDLERQAKDRRARDAKDWRVRVSSRLPSISTGLRRSLSAACGGGSTKGLKGALKRLDLVLGNADKFLATMSHRLQPSCSDNQGHHGDLASRRETMRELTTVAFGRRSEKNAIIEWLGVQATRQVTDLALSVCAIVGDGGMGKTTLAQFVCQDKEVQDHFGGMIIWVHISRHFDPKVLVRKIMGSINRDKASAQAFDPLQSDLIKELLTKRFLLVLDDAWEDMVHERWEQFLGPLRNMAPMGGRILLTTRMASVADAVKRQIPAGFKCLELRGLDQEDTLMLFNHHAYGDSTHSDKSDSELRLIGEQIARNLRGCPFIAKVVGQQLRDNTDYSKWKNVLNQGIHQFDEIVPRIMEMLRLSYQNLTYEVQLCFRYCSIFPPHYKFKVEEVIEMWVSSGLILQRENGLKKQEDIARGHFNTLCRKSFLSLVPRELHADPSDDYYVMHDLMYDLACLVSSEECSRFRVTDHNTNIFPKVRHLYIEGVSSKSIDIISRSNYLRTLIISHEENSIQQELVHDLKKAIKGRTSLRLLKLCGNGIFGMNKAIAELKHLRYISMSATDEPNLCNLFKLYHLEVLRIQKIEKEEIVSFIDISNLPHLQKLHLPKNASSRIPHIGSLTTLRELNGFSVKKKDGHKITELRDLRNLQKVIVLDVQNVSDYNEASSAELDKKTNMKVLSFEWSSDQARIDDRILNKLVPDSNLKHLVISGYNGNQPPMWMENPYLSNLVHLKIDGCVEWDKLPPLGSLWTLKHVILENLPKLKYVGRSSYHSGAYSYSYRGKWTKGPGSDGLPPHLITFVVKDCPDLYELPDLPFSLQHLQIDAVGVSNLPTMCDHKGSRDVSAVEAQLSTLHIGSSDFLISLNGCFLQEEHYRALTFLKLFRCSELRSLPVAADFGRISKLEGIEIIECNSLLSLGGLGALSSLTELKIQHCGNLVTTSLSGSLPISVRSPHLKLETLAIDDHRLLLLSPLTNLCLTKRLIISGRSEMAELPEEWLLQNSYHLEHIEISNAELLQSLPLKMHNMHALRSLFLHDTHILQSLPLMPPNLWVLVIHGCHTELNEKCQVGGSEWTKISRIPNRKISPKENDRH